MVQALGARGEPTVRTSVRTSSARTSALALVVALAVHVLVAVAIQRTELVQFRPADPPVEIAVNEPPPPQAPQARRPFLPQRLATPTALVRPVRHRAINREIDFPKPPTDIPSAPTNQVPSPRAAGNVQSVFGVTISSVIEGTAAVRVPVGDTTMTESRVPANHRPGDAYARNAAVTFNPSPEISAAALPYILQEVNSDDVYPPEARSLGIEGTVELSIGIDEKGRVVQVRVLRRAGHKFDEAAVDAMKKTVFSPARARDGHPIPYRLPYRFVFVIRN